MLLARLGLRAGEVAALSLDDIDWRAGELVVRGKGGRPERLPLPARRRRGDRRLPARAPAMRWTARCSCASARRTMRLSPRRGRRCRGQRGRAHEPGSAWSARTGCATRRRPRCCAAARRSPEVGQVLRHRHAATTAIYAKVDREALRADRAPVAAEAVRERAARGAGRLPGGAPGAGLQARARPDACSASSSTTWTRAAPTGSPSSDALAWAMLPRATGTDWHAMRLGGSARVRALPARRSTRRARCPRRTCCLTASAPRGRPTSTPTSRSRR